MIRDILTNRWCIGGFVFLIVFAVLCHLWYKHDVASFQQQLSATDDIILQADMPQKAQKPNQTDVPPTESLEFVESRSESVEDTSVPTEETTQKTDTFEKNIDLAADVQTSPFGFGTYPEVPADFPFRELLWDNVTPEHELLDRVRVKLWKQGTQTTGAMFDSSNGLIYLSIPGVIYVQWHYVEEGPPEYVGQRYATRVMGNPDTTEKWKSANLTDQGFERTGINSDIETSDIKVYKYPDEGIDPYQFLDLPR